MLLARKLYGSLAIVQMFENKLPLNFRPRLYSTLLHSSKLDEIIPLI